MAKKLSELTDEEVMRLMSGQPLSTDTPLQTLGKGAARTAGRLKSGVEEAMLLGTGQFGSPEMQALQEREAAAEEAYRPSRLENPTAGFIGETAPYLPFGVGGRAAPVVGGLLGAMTYTDDPATRALQTGAGIAGGALGARVPALGRQLQTAESRAARDMGLKVSPGRRTGIRALERFDAGLESFAPTSGPFLGARAANQRQINNVAAEAIGESGDKVTGEMLDRARARLSKEFEDIFANEDVLLDESMLDALQRAKALEVERIVSPEKNLDFTVDKVLDMVAEGRVSGRAYNNMRRDLNRVINKNFHTEAGDPTYAESLVEISEALDDAASRSISSTNKERLAEARKQWGNLRILRNPRSVKIETGDVRPLSAASVAGRENEAAYRFGRNQSDFYNTLRAINAMPDLASSGTAERMSPQTMFNFIGQAGSPLGLLGRTASYTAGLPVLSRLYYNAPGLLGNAARGIVQGGGIPATRGLMEDY